MESPHGRALRDIEDVFGDRLKRGGRNPPGVPDAGDALASVSPMSAEEVKLLAEVAGRYSVPLVALGAGTASKPDPEGGGILIQFDLMRGLRLPEHEESWVEAEPGASWLQLDDLLSARGWGLAVYPTSAPLATVGGWPWMASAWAPSSTDGYERTSCGRAWSCRAESSSRWRGRSCDPSWDLERRGSSLARSCAPGGRRRMYPSVTPSERRRNSQAL